jgi:putative ABC transport system substrate-binding protein
VARAQQGDRVRRVGVLTAGDENDPVRKTLNSAFTQALAELGWTDGRNVRIDLRGGRGDTNRMRTPRPIKPRQIPAPCVSYPVQPG